MKHYISTSLATALLALTIAICLLDSCRSFTLTAVPAGKAPTFSTTTTARHAPMTTSRTGIVLQAEDAAEGESKAEQAEAAAEGEEEAPPTEEAPPAEEAPKEDPEVKAIKEEIAELEKTLKEKKSQIQYLQDSAERYSKAGYARKVAEMENMRRTRSVSTSEGTAKYQYCSTWQRHLFIYGSCCRCLCFRSLYCVALFCSPFLTVFCSHLTFHEMSNRRILMMHFFFYYIQSTIPGNGLILNYIRFH